MGGAPGWALGRGAVQREDRLRRRVDMECRCTRGAAEWTWDVVAFGRRRWLGGEGGGAAEEGATLRERRRLDRVLRRVWEAPKGRH